jgi:zinc protease
LTSLRHLGRTFTYETEMEKKIKALTRDQVASAVRRHLDPKRLVIVTGGDFEPAVAGSSDQ